MEYTYNIKELPEVVTQLLLVINSKVVLIYGEMGVGKTTLIKEMLKQLGADDFNGSPTYSIINEYETTTEMIYHYDLFRIDDERELLDIGCEEYIYSDNWNIIEWPEKLETLLPQNYSSVYISENEIGNRTLKIMRVN